MRLKDISSAHHGLLEQLARGISGRLQASFVELADGDQANIGVALREGQRSVVIELPLALVATAVGDAVARELLRTRVKARRDRMMFRIPPPPLPKNIVPMFGAGPARPSFRGGRR